MVLCYYSMSAFKSSGLFSTPSFVCPFSSSSLLSFTSPSISFPYQACWSLEHDYCETSAVATQLCTSSYIYLSFMSHYPPFHLSIVCFSPWYTHHIRFVPSLDRLLWSFTLSSLLSVMSLSYFMYFVSGAFISCFYILFAFLVKCPLLVLSTFLLFFFASWGINKDSISYIDFL